MKQQMSVIVATTLMILSGMTGRAWAGPGHSGGHGDGMSAHMARMAETREQLEKRLGDRYDKPVRAAKPGEVERGKGLYKQYCASCHGESGKGDGPAGKTLNPPAADLTDPMHAYFYSDQGRLEIIRNGSPGTAMPGWSNTLKGDDLMAVYQYVRTLRPPQKGMQMAGMKGHDMGGMKHDMKGMHGDHKMGEGHQKGKMMHNLEARDGDLTGKLEPQGTLASGNKQKLLLRLVDADGHPVKAKSVKVNWSMPSMGHDMGATSALPQKEAGTWRIGYKFPMGGHYRAEAVVKMPAGETHKLVFDIMVP